MVHESLHGVSYVQMYKTTHNYGSQNLQLHKYSAAMFTILTENDILGDQDKEHVQVL